jgi:hypothetical protein
LSILLLYSIRTNLDPYVEIIFDIDPSYEITNIIRSHRVGKPDEKAAAEVKHRQIIVRLCLALRRLTNCLAW